MLAGFIKYLIEVIYFYPYTLCILSDVGPTFPDHCTENGIAFAFWFRIPDNVTFGNHKVAVRHAYKNGFRIEIVQKKLRMNLLTTNFKISCPEFDVNFGHHWTHLAIVFRIRPSYKLYCYVNGSLEKTETITTKGRDCKHWLRTWFIRTSRLRFHRNSPSQHTTSEQHFLQRHFNVLTLCQRHVLAG